MTGYGQKKLVTPWKCNYLRTNADKDRDELAMLNHSVKTVTHESSETVLNLYSHDGFIVDARGEIKFREASERNDMRRS